MTAEAPEVGRHIVDTLLAEGVRRLVLSPGSRSAPVAVAAAHREAAGSLDLRVRVDERSGGFLAVGMAKATGRPAAVLCTSGTAVANLLPAVVEARYSGVPLVVLTADRPPELRGRGASQTIDQVGMFDRFVLGSWDLGADAAPADAEQVVRAAVGLARRGRGPVHINTAFRPPLVDREGADQPAAADPRTAVDDAAPPQLPRPHLGGVPSRGVIIAGDIDVWDETTRAHVAATAASLGWPIVPEATSGLAGAPTAVPGAAALLADPAVRERLQPDLVITVGPFGMDRGVLGLVRAADRHIAVRLRPRTDPPDPLDTAEQVLDAFPSADGQPDPTWVQLWRSSAAHCPPPRGPMSDMVALLGVVQSALTPDDLLVLAPSLAIRAAAHRTGPGPAVLANRGANGIDGVVSTAWGAASVWQRGRTVAVLGDLALLHDQNGLLVPRVEERPDLTYVVADNNGGGIFHTLEQGAPEFAGIFERVFATPHDRDPAAALAAAGIPVTTVAGPTQPPAVLLPPGGGVRAVVVPVTR